MNIQYILSFYTIDTPFLLARDKQDFQVVRKHYHASREAGFDFVFIWFWRRKVMSRKKKNSGEVTDLELVEQFKNGSVEAFEELLKISIKGL
ncbi:MAG: hypothetical protein R3A13_04735 [Bdellovibrionota bacterium]